MPHHKIIFAPHERSLTVGATAGLSARLRILIAGMAVAELTNRKFKMLWPLSSHCSAAFSDLFCNEWNIEEMEESGWAEVKALEKFQFSSMLKLKSQDVKELGFRFMDPNSLKDIPTIQLHFQRIINQLKPRSEIIARVEEFKAKNFVNKMIGVHLRRGDCVSLFPRATSNTKQAIKATNRFLAKNPTAKIFLCTDDGAENQTPGEDVKAIFRERFGVRVVTNEPTTLDRTNPVAISDALVDLWLLRGTDFFVGSAYSGFSEMVIMGRNLPNKFVDGLAFWELGKIRKRLSNLLSSISILLKSKQTF